jgi:hypothetical protein
MTDPADSDAHHLADRGQANDGLQIMIIHALWVQWGEIAVEREASAREARALLVAQHRHGQAYGSAFDAEFTASLVAVSAVAHALDAMYGQLITETIRAAGPKSGVGREAHIRECLKRRFDTGKRDRHWVAEFGWLFGLRDAAVHARVELLPPAAHPSGIGRSGQMTADYSTDAAMRAVDLLIDVFTTCVANPKPNDQEAKNWATSYDPTVQSLLMKLQISRDAIPLASG